MSTCIIGILFHVEGQTNCRKRTSILRSFSLTKELQNDLDTGRFSQRMSTRQM